MPVSGQDLVDGTVSFQSGMDASRHPADVDQSGYYKGINILIPRSRGGITNRGGLHCQSIDWNKNNRSKEIYEKGHIQGTGWYWNGNRTVHIKSVNGYIIELIQGTPGDWSGRVLNYSDPNPSDRTKVWITTIPSGVIINDGISTPFIIDRTGIRRSNPGAGEITAGRMGAYVQNRFFYVNTAGNFIQASDFKNPISIQNSSDTNVHGFENPQEFQITAIGRQKALLDTALVGVLSWSDGFNIYSADVRGSRESWENLGSNAGKIQQVVPSIGATSSFSFVNFNTNLYFRNKDFGLCDMRQSQSQFANENDFEQQSQEVDYWFGRDTNWMLDQCYTVRFKNRLYTTVAGEISEQGYVFWNGMVVAHPNPNNSSRESNYPRRFEGLITGVRPWCMVVTEPPSLDSEFLIDSYDVDGINRLYKYVEDSDYDTNQHGTRIEIESIIETRAYTGGYRNEPKQIRHRFYSLGDLKRDLFVQVDTRPEGYGQYSEQFKIIHRIKSCCNISSASKANTCFNPLPIKPQERKRVSVDEEPENDPNNPDYSSSNTHCSRQYRFRFKGPFRLYQFITVSKPVDWDKLPANQELEDQLLNPYLSSRLSDYTYNIADENNNEFVEGFKMNVDNKPS